MNRDYTYFCPNKDHEEHTDTFSWSLEEFDLKKNKILCPLCKNKMLIDISPRKIKDNPTIGFKGSTSGPQLNYSKSTNGRDGRSFF